MVIGMTCAVFLLVITWWHCRKDQGDREKIDQMYQDLRKLGLGKVVYDSIWAILSPVIILGGIFSGLLDVASAASVSVIYAAFVAVFIYKTLDFKGLWKAFLESVKSVAGVSMLLAFAASFGNLLNAFNGNEIIANAAASVFSTPASFITASILLMTIAMFFMNPSAVVAPILSPVLDVLNINRSAFGAGLSGLGAIGSLTPPFGMGLYVVAPIVNEDPMKICKTLLPVWAGMTIIISIFMYFPQLCTWVL
jgi:C4-dicarboxylate transporter DctM subunit